ncbi:hypothetical protein [Ruminococcus sp. Marseille-P6503]|uniref:hypothetical protein n=1 Tax=Ruminococcus sp. Marseille-P6503 TaxID=2364796 RepID=UPI0013DE2B7D|nr:hypothetical protein [Ruminococcus sp. Marseille-P6503]
MNKTNYGKCRNDEIRIFEGRNVWLCSDEYGVIGNSGLQSVVTWISYFPMKERSTLSTK